MTHHGTAGLTTCCGLLYFLSYVTRLWRSGKYLRVITSSILYIYIAASGFGARLLLLWDLFFTYSSDIHTQPVYDAHDFYFPILERYRLSVMSGRRAAGIR